MEQSLTVKGAEGSLRWVYHLAATLRHWTIEKSAGGYSLTATVVNADTFRVSQRPLTFVAPVQGVSWRFPLTTLQITGVSLSATLGPKE